MKNCGLGTHNEKMFADGTTGNTPNTPKSMVHNHVKLKVSPRILYCGGLGGSLGDYRPALLKGWKHRMVKTQTESQDWRPIV